MAKRKKIIESRTELIGVRYTLEQRQKLEAQAKPIPLSTYIRNLSLHRSQPKSIPAVNLETYQQLQKISFSLAQIAHALPTFAQHSEVVKADQLSAWFSLLQDFKLEIKQLGQKILAANVEEAEDEEVDSNEFTL